MKKRLLSIIAVACALVMSITLFACGNAPQAKAEALVTVDINPSIELTLDKNNKVLSVYGANEDGQILIYNETGIVGVDVETAVAKITALAEEYGYLTSDNKVVNTSVTAEDQNKAQAILDKVNAKITATAEDFDFAVTVAQENVYSLVRKYQDFRAKNQNVNVDINQFKLALSASETGEVTLDVAIEMDTDELLDVIKDRHQTVKAYTTKAYESAKALAERTYQNAEAAALDGIYVAHYLSNMLKHPTTFYYGAEYFAYKTLARTLETVADAMATIGSAVKQELTPTYVTQIMTALDITDRTLIENSEGKVTIESVESYANKLFKNSPAGVELETIKTNLTTVLNNVEAIVKTEVDGALSQYEEQITNVIGQVNAQLPAGVTELLGDLNTLIGELQNILNDGKITALELRELAQEFNDNAEEVLGKIQRDLSAEELAKINQAKESVAETLANAKATLNNAIQTAENTAKEHFDQIKNSIKQTA